MESVLSQVGVSFFNGITPKGVVVSTHFKGCSLGVGGGGRPKRAVLVKAEAVGINPDIRKSEEKVVDSVVVTEISKPVTAYCR